MSFDLSLFLEPGPELISGLGVTLFVTLCAFLLAAVGGTILAIAGIGGSPRTRRSVSVITAVTRTTPELIAIFWAYYCLPMIFGLTLSGIACGILALGVIGSGYMAEIIRGGVSALPRGQWEAAHSLGLSRMGTWLKVILPQALRTMLPSLLNYFTDVLKNSTLLAGIGVGEIAYEAYMAGSATYRYLEPLTGVALLFFIVIFPLSLVARRLARRNSLILKAL